jgi:hypothetical protein
MDVTARVEKAVAVACGLGPVTSRAFRSSYGYRPALCCNSLEIRCPETRAAREENRMLVAYIIVASVFTVVLTTSARMKLVRAPVAVEVLGGVVGVPLRLFPILAVLEIAGAVGLLAGIGLEPLGVAAAVGLVAYFIVATSSHLRKRDLVAGHVVPPVTMLVISALALALRLAA